MKPDIVVDIGNSRMKWGRCVDRRVEEMAIVAVSDRGAWQHQLNLWKLGASGNWAVAGVQPAYRDNLVEWLKQKSATVLVLEKSYHVQIPKKVLHPDRVGIDRLLNGVAAKERVQRDASIIIIDAGSAVTVDWIDESGDFRGGAIFPGLRLMGLALKYHTAQLPQVEVTVANPDLPGTDTQGAIEAGVYWAVAGGIKALVRQLLGKAQAEREHKVFLTGGDAKLLAPVMDADVILWPEMTLEGIRISAEALP